MSLKPFITHHKHLRASRSHSISLWSQSLLSPAEALIETWDFFSMWVWMSRNAKREEAPHLHTAGTVCQHGILYLLTCMGVGWVVGVLRDLVEQRYGLKKATYFTAVEGRGRNKAKGCACLSASLISYKQDGCANVSQAAAWQGGCQGETPFCCQRGVMSPARWCSKWLTKNAGMWA